MKKPTAQEDRIDDENIEMLALLATPEGQAVGDVELLHAARKRLDSFASSEADAKGGE